MRGTRGSRGPRMGMSGHDDPGTIWNDVAAAWDESVDYVNGIAAPATDALVDSLEVTAGDRLLELAGGPGTLGERWANLVGPGGKVLVSDGSPAMVDAAARRLSPFPNVRTAHLDLTNLDRPDSSADIVVCRFGLMFVEEPARVLTEVHRVLAPGGRLGTMTWAGIELNPWVATVGMAAMANGILTGGPPVGPGELFSLSDPDRLAALAGDGGFGDVSVTEADLVFGAPDVDTHVRMVERLAAPLAVAFASATPDQVAAVHSFVSENSAPFSTGDGYEFPGKALLLTARKP